MPGAVVERGERVALRTAEPEDLPFLQRAWANPELRNPLGNVRPRSRAEIEERLEDDANTKLIVCLEAGDAEPGRPDADEVTRIGEITVTDVEWSRTGIAYWIVPEFQGEGYGREAVSLAVDHVFRSVDAPSLGATAYDFNDASRGLLESLGFTEEGRLRKSRFIDGDYRDAVQYGILREEWREQRDARRSNR